MLTVFADRSAINGKRAQKQIWDCHFDGYTRGALQFLLLPERGERNEAMQTVIFRAEAVQRPCTQRWADQLSRSGVNLSHRPSMHGLITLH